MRGLGNDIIEIARIAKAIERNGSRFLDELFTQAEQEYCFQYSQPERHFAGRFAAKESIVKALGTGTRGIHWLDIEILNDSLGKPIVKLSSSVKDRFNSPELLISISHCKTHATAVAVWL